jgi:hypothetical protein
MSAITLYSIANAVCRAQACERVSRTPEEVSRFPQILVVSRKWAVEVDENDKRHLLARWAKNG